ncbi:hypothetical protein LAZ67_2005734 [Cordylochernes scorpioides]|uniref:Mos1 transposase HTH domain-containing protein n=1 Tax=Cordylochernes scorpioides TaxID=51811 RepID=A0ABY6K976_9ARAC|nr:hypothetical protein LAZ67_2005734 [Cordylochernes scorpioides]
MQPKHSRCCKKAFKDDCISSSQSGKWHKAFKEGREEVADEPRSGRPTTARTDENLDRVLEVLRTDRRLSIQQIADTLHMSTFVVHGIVTEDLQMRKVCAKLVPKVLTQDQKELRNCWIQNEPDFLNSVVTGNESWMFKYDPESKRQSFAWHTKSSLRPKKVRMSKSRIKTIIIVFFDIRGIVIGQTVHSAFYLEVLRRLKRRIASVRTDIEDTVKLHHDNATSHTAFIITNFLARSNTPVIPHPPYSLDLAPCDFFLFPRLKREMKGKHWETVENIQHHVTTFLRSILVEEFQGAFQVWQMRLHKCIDAGGIISQANHPASELTKQTKIKFPMLGCQKLVSSLKFNWVFWIVFDFYLLKKIDQRTCIKFCVKNEIKCADAFRMLAVANGEATLDRSNVYRWYKMFLEGREEVNDEERAGRPSTSTTDEKINEVEKMILANRRITLREVAEDLNILIGSCHSIFINDLGMRRVAAKFVPKLLNCDQKQHRMKHC